MTTAEDAAAALGLAAELEQRLNRAVIGFVDADHSLGRRIAEMDRILHELRFVTIREHDLRILNVAGAHARTAQELTGVQDQVDGLHRDSHAFREHQRLGTAAHGLMRERADIADIEQDIGELRNQLDAVAAKVNASR